MSKNTDDEMLLAEMIAAAKSRGLEHTTLARFRDDLSVSTDQDRACYCFTLGALQLDLIDAVTDTEIGGIETKHIAHGNDTFSSKVWCRSTLGYVYAFALGMQDV